MQEIFFVILLAFALDLAIGDPQNPIHPIRIIGTLIGLGVKLFKKAALKNKFLCFACGAILSLLTILFTYFATSLLINLCVKVNFWVGFSVQVILCYFIIAAKALKKESMKVYLSIEHNDLEGARRNLSYIVGRDTQNLTFPQIIKGAVETVAENLSDGVIAPVIFVFIGGVPLGLAYKAVNTLDSMIGYRNETFEYFGKFAARLDDLVNFIPARISAVLMILSAYFAGGNTKRAIKIYLRDRRNHKSPNSAQTEAVCAGALGLMLGGDNFYHGELVHKPTIGDDVNPPEIRHIAEANRLMYATVVLAILIMGLVSLVWSFVNAQI